MKVTLWGTRGSIAAPGPETAYYGGNTPCVAVEGNQGTTLVLDAGTGIRRLGGALPCTLKRVDLLLTHLHMDHLQGLGFFAPLYNPALEVHIWGPPSAQYDLRTRLIRYLSPPLFPVLLRDLPCKLSLHEVADGDFTIGEFCVQSELICHPGPTVGYRIVSENAVLTYLPDHEPALGVPDFPAPPKWTSGYSLAHKADLLIHDAQYSNAEYATRIGWGHSSMEHALRFAIHAKVRSFVAFHHDPAHSDKDVKKLLKDGVAAVKPSFPVVGGAENKCFTLGNNSINLLEQEENG